MGPKGKRQGPDRPRGDPEVGARLRSFRRLHDLKQEDLAALWRTDRKLVGFYEQGRRRLPVDKAKILAERYRDLDLNWLLLGKGATPAGQIAQEVETLKQAVAELRSSYASQSSPAGLSPADDEIIEDFLRSLDLKDAIRDVTRLGSIRVAAAQQAFRDTSSSLELTPEQIVAEAAPRILRQFREFLRKRRGF